MSRKKTAKRAVKRQTNSNSTTAIQKDFQQATIKAAAQLNIEATRAKQQVAKLAATHNKIQNDIKKADARIKNAQKAKPTASSKKQIKTATKQRANASKLLAAVTKQLNDAEKALAAAANAQAKLVALRKHVAQFEQIWAKTPKKANKTKTASKTKRKAKAKNVAVSEKAVVQNIQPLHVAENNDDVLDTATELAS